MKQNKIITPIGKASWPHLNEKNTYDANPEQHKYDCKLLVPEEDAKEFIAKMQTLYQEGLEDAIKRAKTPKIKRELREASKNLPIAKVRDDDDQLTGEISLIAKNKNKPLIVDASGTPMSEKIGSGSELRFSVIPRFFGPINENNYLSLTLGAVQVIELVEWGAYGGPSDAAEAGFDTVADGFTTSNESEDEEDEFSESPSGEAKGAADDF